MKLRFLIPLAVFIGLVVFFAFGLQRDPREIPSPLVGKPAPAFHLARLDSPDRLFGPEQMKGRVWLLNVWASWCVSCREEHPVLVQFAQMHKDVPIVGFSYKEVRGDTSVDSDKLTPEAELQLARQRAQTWLSERGDPYLLTAFDLDGRVGIDYGVYGVPETYVIDKQGVIRMKHIGPVTPKVLQEKILPTVQALST